jgi:hypothetical protein
MDNENRNPDPAADEPKPRYNRASYRKKVRSVNALAGAFRAKNNERAMKAKARAARKASHRVYVFRADA